jgi:mono/diheme cytochrome c family protein
MRRRHLVLLLVLASLLLLVAAGCGGDDDSDSSAPPATTTEESGGGSGSGDAANGEEVFASAGCGGCHTFEAAGSTGSTGPNLDELAPSFDEVVEQVTNGGGAMPAFAGELSEQEIRDVATYVSSRATGS